MADLSALTQYAVVAFASLFILVDPLATAPLFLVMTEGDPPDKRRQMARRAAWMAFLTLTGFALLGDVLLRLFSLTLSAFRIAGGIILFGIALNMLRLRRVREIQTPEEVQEGLMQDDIALIPLAFPMLSGPGAIATVMALTQPAPTLGHRVVILAAIVVTCSLAYIILGYAAQVTAFYGQGQRRKRCSRKTRAATDVESALEPSRDAKVFPHSLHDAPVYRRPVVRITGGQTGALVDAL